MDWNGLAAEFSDLMGGDDPGEDYDYYRRIIERNGGTALDVGCGTGRLLLRYLRLGLDVEGVDSAADSLAVCRRKAESQGLTPVLHEQPMQALDLRRRFRTIFIPCGSFQLLADHAEAVEALKRFHAHLEVDGVLVFGLIEPSWEDMTDEGMSRRPSPWWVLSEAIRPNDGARLVVYWMKASIDRVEQLLVNQRRYEVWLGDRLVDQEHRSMRLRWYYKHEMLLMLKMAGFRDIEVDATSQYSPRLFSGMWLFSGRK